MDAVSAAAGNLKERREGAPVALSLLIGYKTTMTTEAKDSQVDTKVRKAVEEVLRDRLADYGYTGVNVAPGQDRDGDPVLLVDVRYKALDKPIASKETFGLVTAIRQQLARIGETRFPHIRHHFDEQQKIAS